MESIPWQQYPYVAEHAVARAFIEANAKRQRRPKTLDAYARNLDDLLRFFEHQGIDPLYAQVDHIESYLADLCQRPPLSGRERVRSLAGAGLADATVQQRLVTARLFYDFCVQRGWRSDPINPVLRGHRGDGGTPPRRGLFAARHHLPWIPTDAEWATLVTYLLRHTSRRNQCLVLLAYDAALRRSELVALRLRDIDWATGILHVRAETTKTGAERFVPISRVTEALLQQYIQGERQQILAGFGGDISWPIFLSESPRNAGAPLCSGAFNDLLARIRTQVALPQIHPHTFRHLRCTVLKRCGVPLDDIALFAGHASDATTQVYLHLAPTELSKRIRRATAAFDAHMEQLIQEAGGHA